LGFPFAFDGGHMPEQMTVNLLRFGYNAQQFKIQRLGYRLRSIHIPGPDHIADCLVYNQHGPGKAVIRDQSAYAFHIPHGYIVRCSDQYGIIRRAKHILKSSADPRRTIDQHIGKVFFQPKDDPLHIQIRNLGGIAHLRRRQKRKRRITPMADQRLPKFARAAYYIHHVIYDMAFKPQHYIQAAKTYVCIHHSYALPPHGQANSQGGSQGRLPHSAFSGGYHPCLAHQVFPFQIMGRADCRPAEWIPRYSASFGPCTIEESP
jgi:hypothetical protein